MLEILFEAMKVFQVSLEEPSVKIKTKKIIQAASLKGQKPTGAILIFFNFDLKKTNKFEIKSQNIFKLVLLFQFWLTYQKH